MTMQRQPEDNRTTRRDFLKTSTVAAAGAALATNLSLLKNAHAAGSDIIKVGLIGCGGRGTGAADNVLHSAPGVQIYALADVFDDRLQGARSRLRDIAQSDGKVKELGNKVDVSDDRCFTGLKGYEGLLNSGVNYVMLATPPGFRPIHIEATIAAGKNLFTEKPVGVDGPGIRKVLAAYEEANQKKLGVAAGTQRRHQAGYLETVKQLHDGAIGEITAGRCYWNQGGLWSRAKEDGWSDVEWQIRNWLYFTWLSGDHICEQHVHNLDVINWVTQAHPVRAVGMGGRQVRTEPVFGHIFDHFAIDYEYPKGVHVLSMCRQIDGCENSVSEAVVGTQGQCQVNAYTINGKRVSGRRTEIDPYVQEHTDLIDSIRAGKPINELKNVAESTLTAIMGRMTAYTGKAVTWDKALKSTEDLMPPKLDLKMSLPVPPVAVPGKTPLV
jgi:predicted dehydrogenase